MTIEEMNELISFLKKVFKWKEGAPVGPLAEVVKVIDKWEKKFEKKGMLK